MNVDPITSTLQLRFDIAQRALKEIGSSVLIYLSSDGDVCCDDIDRSSRSKLAQDFWRAFSVADKSVREPGRCFECWVYCCENGNGIIRAPCPHWDEVVF